MIPASGPGHRRFGNPLILAAVDVTALAAGAGGAAIATSGSPPVASSSQTYQVTSSTLVDAQRAGIGSVKDGHQVSVLATVSGGTATATNIEDLSLRQAGHPAPNGNGPGSSSG
jgi:hypothetical protein